MSEESDRPKNTHTQLCPRKTMASNENYKARLFPRKTGDAYLDRCIRRRRQGGEFVLAVQVTVGRHQAQIALEILHRPVTASATPLPQLVQVHWLRDHVVVVCSTKSRPSHSRCHRRCRRGYHRRYSGRYRKEYTVVGDAVGDTV